MENESLRVLTLNWGHGPYSISKIVTDIENTLKPEGVRFLHVQESGAVIGDNYIRLSGWFMTRVYYVWAHVSGNRYGTGYIPYLKWKRIMNQFSPEVVHIHCPNGFTIDLYKVLAFLKKKKIPTVITNHAEFFYTGNCSHAEECTGFQEGCRDCNNFKEKTSSLYFNRTAWAWEKMRKAFQGFENIEMVAVSPWSLSRMKLSPICNHLPACVVKNGINTEVFCADSNKKLPKKRKIVLHVTANFSDDENKGGRYVLKLAELCENEPIDFVVVGKQSLVGTNIPQNIRLVGSIENQSELASYYQEADVTLVTSKRETFGMVCAESLCCGTPVAGFLNGGMESIAIPEYTSFVPFGDMERLKEELFRFLNREFDSIEISKKACDLYSREKMARDYLEIYRDIVRNRKENI